MEKQIYKLPQKFIERIDKYFPTYRQQILRASTYPHVTTFRINRIHIDHAQWRTMQRKQLIHTEQVPWFKDAHVLRTMQQRELQKLDVYKDGIIYLQNLSSMVPPLLLDPQPGETILDLCAAPGSKTTQLASLTQNQADIVAVEKIKPRFFRLKANLTMQGASSVNAILGDGALIARRYPEHFDKVLVDAPCSSEGLFRTYKKKSYAYWSPRKVKEMRHKQRRLIDAGWRALKKRGTLVYSTCTFSPDENESVVNWLLRKYPEEIEVKKFSLPFPNTISGILSADTFAYDDRLRYTRRILPTKTMEGFFVAVLGKNA